MTTAGTASATRADDKQVVCIDLPGETVRCWRSSAHLMVVLRKHRDIVFDIKLFPNQVYTVRAEHGEFYDTKSKKLISPGKSVTFKDGERAHFWVSRDFIGTLFLTASGKVLGRYRPNDLDFSDISQILTDKPAPLIVTLHNAPMAASVAPVFSGAQWPRFDPDSPVLAAPGAGEEQSMHVIELKKDQTSAPKEILDFIKSGGDETAIKPDSPITRNWIFATIAGQMSYLWDNKHWIKELWGQKFYLKKQVHVHAGTKYYIIFKGNPKLREFFTAARYGIQNSKVLSITGGLGNSGGLRHGAWEAAKGSLKRAGAIAVIFTIVLDTAEWLKDYEQIDPKTGKRKKDFFDLVYKIGIDVAKAGLSAALGAAAVGVLVFAGIVTGGAALVVGTILVTILIGYAIDKLDKKTGFTDKLNKSIRNSADSLEKALPKDYGNYGSVISGAMATGVR